MTLQQLPLDHVCALLAADTPTPGGGSVAALSGALAVALADMVTRLSLKRSGENAPTSAWEALLPQLEALRRQLLDAMDADAKAFDGVMAAIKRPKTTPTEQEQRSAALETALQHAALVPLGVAHDAAKVFDWVGELLKHGNPNATSDAMVAVMAARTAMLGALANVRINLASIKDADFVKATMTDVLALETLANEREAELLAIGYARLTP